MEKFKFIILFLSILYGTGRSFAQIDDSKKILTLDEKIEQNEKLFKESPEQALKILDQLIEEAKVANDKDVELKLISDRCKYYYYLKRDFEQMVGSANSLRQKAIKYGNHYYEAKAHKYLAQAYFFNNLYDKSIRELQSGLDVLDKTNPEDSLIIIERANHYIAFANIYSFGGENFNALRSLKHALQEHEKLKDPNLRRKSKFLDYANLGGVYLNIDLDSARYFAELSLKLRKEGEFPDQVFLNYIVLGNVFKERKQYEQALDWYKKAELIKENKNYLNIEKLYSNFIEIYDVLGNQNLKNEYEIKLKDFQLTISENKNNSLKKIIEITTVAKRVGPKSGNKFDYIYYLLIIFLFAVIGIAYYLAHRSKKQVLSENKITASSVSRINTERYIEFINLLKKNDQAFLREFENEFPGFRTGLSGRFPKLTEIEIDLLCMLKLGLSAKEIARFTFVQPKTIQNRRTVARNKMNMNSNDELQRYLNSL